MKARPLHIDPSEVRRIQVFHLNHLGDVVFSLPLLASLRRHFPRARILSVVRPEMIPVWEMAGLSEEYLARDRHASWRRRLALARALKKREPQLSFVMSQSLEPCLLARLSGSPRRIGFTRTKLGWLLTDRVVKIGPPSTANNLRLLEAVGIKPARTDYVGLLKAPLGEMGRMEATLADMGVPHSKRLVVLGPGASPKRSIKEWTDQGFAAVADHFSALPDTAVAIVGTVSADPILQHTHGPVLDFTTRTSLKDLAALLARADLFIGVDSGALHVAGAVGTPAVGLYGPSDPKFTGPQGPGSIALSHPVPCHPCFQTECSVGRKCLELLQPEEVIEAAEKVLRDSATRSPHSDLKQLDAAKDLS
ncbi:MAG: glycosyltransferase family 9 protein [Armatimonadetes bacterium]|nr:glycosyltransferase family 9 protein [Armatimonadota bacterium]